MENQDKAMELLTASERSLELGRADGSIAYAVQAVVWMLLEVKESIDKLSVSTE